jgi:hypothetical protein
MKKESLIANEIDLNIEELEERVAPGIATATPLEPRPPLHPPLPPVPLPGGPR